MRERYAREIYVGNAIEPHDMQEIPRILSDESHRFREKGGKGEGGKGALGGNR